MVGANLLSVGIEIIKVCLRSLAADGSIGGSHVRLEGVDFAFSHSEATINPADNRSRSLVRHFEFEGVNIELGLIDLLFKSVEVNLRGFSADSSLRGRHIRLKGVDFAFSNAKTSVNSTDHGGRCLASHVKFERVNVELGLIDLLLKGLEVYLRCLASEDGAKVLDARNREFWDLDEENLFVAIPIEFEIGLHQ